MRRNLIVKEIPNKTNSVQLSDLNHRMMMLIDSKNTCLNLTNNNVDLYCSWLPYGSKSIGDTEIGINALVADTMGLREGDIVSCKIIEDLVSLESVCVTVDNQKEWEILDASRNRISSTLLNHALILNEGKKLIVWVNGAIHLTISIDKLLPEAKYGRIEKNTEVVVEPFRRSLTENRKLSMKKLNMVREEKNGNSLYERLYRKNDPKYETTASTHLNVLDSVIDSRTLDDVTKKAESAVEHDSSSESISSIYDDEKHAVFALNTSKESKSKESNTYDFFESILMYLKNIHDRKLYKFRVIPRKWCNDTQMCDVLLTRHNTPEGFDLTPSPYILSGEAINDNDERILKEYYVNIRVSEGTQHSPKNIYPSIEVNDILLAQLKLKKFSQVALSTKKTVLNFIEKIELSPLKIKQKNDFVLNRQDVLEDFKRLIMKCCRSTPNQFLINQKQIFLCGGNQKQSYYVMAKIYPESFKYCLCDDEILRENKIFVVEQNQENFSHILIAAEEISQSETQTDETDKSYVNMIQTDKIINECIENLVRYNCLDQTNRLRKANNYLIIGSQTSGKSSVCHEILRRLKSSPFFCYVETFNCAQNKSRKVDSIQKDLRNILTNCVEHAPSILLLENLDALTKATSDHSQNAAEYYNNISDIVKSLIDSYTQKCAISVIATVSHINYLNQRLYTSRGNHLFESLHKIPDLTKENRKRIIEERCKQHTMHINESHFDKLANLTEGYTIGYLLQFIDRAIFYAYRNDNNKPNLTMECLMESLRTTNEYCLQGIENHLDTCENVEKEKEIPIAGMESVVSVFQEVLMWPQQYPNIFENSPLRNQAGILLYGAPGTGKTHVVSQISRQWNLRVISVKGPELLAKFIGQSEENVRNLFDRARSARPCVLFFDEFDSIAPRRGHDSTGVTDRVVNQLLTELDGVEELRGVVVVAATSRPDLIDPALLRSGRLDRLVQCSLPDAATRLKIFKSIAQTASLRLADDINFDMYCDRFSDYYTAADIKSVLVTANMLAVKNSVASNSISNKIVINQNHMQEAFQNTKPSISYKESIKYKTLYAKFMNREESRREINDQQRATLA